MNVLWVIEEDAFDDNANKIADIAVTNGMRAVKKKYVPFSNAIDLEVHDGEVVIPYCSVNMAKQLKEYCWFDLENLKCSTYHSYFGEYLLQKCSMFTTWNELKRQKNFLYKQFGIAGRIFIKPDQNTKSFCGQLVSEFSFDEWWHWVNDLNAVSPRSLVLVARPEEITNEYRFVVIDKKVITGSQYSNNHELCIRSSFSESSYDFACMIANNEWQPDEVYVLDVAETFRDDGSKSSALLEFGSVNCAGLYACDIEKFVIELSKKVIE